VRISPLPIDGQRVAGVAAEIALRHRSASGQAFETEICWERAPETWMSSRIDLLSSSSVGRDSWSCGCRWSEQSTADWRRQRRRRRQQRLVASTRRPGGGAKGNRSLARGGGEWSTVWHLGATTVRTDMCRPPAAFALAERKQGQSARRTVGWQLHSAISGRANRHASGQRSSAATSSWPTEMEMGCSLICQPSSGSGGASRVKWRTAGGSRRPSPFVCARRCTEMQALAGLQHNEQVS
jgi:hypothetical protein